MAWHSIRFKHVWQVVAVLVLLNHAVGRVVVGNGETRAKWPHYLLPYPDERLNDFFQEWASARNWHTGMPVYSHHAESIPAHLGLTVTELKIAHNAHPPTSVLLVLPLGWGTLRQALAVWHLLSLLGIALSAWLVAREWRERMPVAWGWWVLPILAIALSWKPMIDQLETGQMNGGLLPLFVAAWVAWRRGYSGWAGVFLGVATAIKIFPAFFFLLFVVRCQPRGILTGALTVAGLTCLTVGVLGYETYHDYFANVLPSLRKYWPDRYNDSVVGFWYRLFAENTCDRMQPWVISPTLAWFTSGLSAFAIVAVVGWHVFQARTVAALDRAYWLMATAVVLLGPLTWPHSALLLSVGLAYLVRDVRPTMPPHTGMQWLLVGILSCFFVHPARLCQERGWMPDPVPPWASVAVCSIPLAVNLVLFAWQCHFVRRADQQANLA